jgi:excisionase family DNA binding protein
MNAERQWLTPREVAALLNIGLTTVRSYIRQGRLPACRLKGSRLLRVHIGDLEALLVPRSPREPREPLTTRER